jgi:hypothetical protein
VASRREGEEEGNSLSPSKGSFRRKQPQQKETQYRRSFLILLDQTQRNGVEGQTDNEGGLPPLGVRFPARMAILRI